LARPYAVVGWLATVVGAVGGIALRIVDPVPMIPNSFGFGDTALVGFEFLGLTFASVGGLLVVRRPENAVGWCMVPIGAGHALAGLAAAVTASALADGPAGAATAGLAGWSTVLFTTIGGLVFGLGFIFPTGRGHTPAWDRFVRLGAVAFPFVLVVGFLIRPGPLQIFPTIDNPFGVGPDFRPVFGSQMSQIVAASSAAFVPFLGLSIASRYRMADSVGRQQLKWFVLALLASLGGLAVAALGALITKEPPEAGLAVFGFAGALVPVAIGIAILRHNLYDIDRLVSRSIAYVLITAVLVAAYAGVVVVIGGPLGSASGGDTIAVALSTLVVAALFQPLRRRVQTLVDRRFDRARIDAERTTAAFSERLRDEIDIETVTADLRETVNATIRPDRLGVWLREAGR
ncbi:MAG: hypothetical protein ABI562_06485, partial [Chloroflexota bacterium]